jgi:hypothetical protein
MNYSANTALTHGRRYFCTRGIDNLTSRSSTSSTSTRGREAIDIRDRDGCRHHRAAGGGRRGEFSMDSRHTAKQAPQHGRCRA